MKELRKIIAAYASVDPSKEKMALASVVKVEESSYRRIGARMLVRSNGMWTGGISGGCLEGDALRRSQKAIFKNESSKVVYDTLEDDQNQIGVGLGCNGRIEVVFTPIDPSDLENEIEQLKKIIDAESPSILLKIINIDKTSEGLGNIKLVNEQDNVADWNGISARILNEMIDDTLARKKPRIFPCKREGGEKMEVLVEFIRPETKMVVIGDNYDVTALLGIGHELGWKLHVVGKQKKLSKEVYNMAKEVVDYDQASSIDINEYTAVILISHDYNIDKKMLPLFLQKKPGYLGMLGPKKRMLKMQKELSFYDLKNISYFYSPIGLDIGAETPEEIALAITAEIIASFRQKKGGSLRYKTGTIHNRE